ncbi:Uncharacterized protein BM_BM8377 [Brugia malayi]|uniref:Bm2940 n=1 Tax=Brugia malayi TaxID=6279 RepID=A0A1P6CDE8_BRUMA|nr:Uncharacterized protein BM_BM8377 [Brugia malayi]CRZ24677.1 Bm2940 [Brugia malayi]VIO97323.1 Uncharacterized protein BM_BM8377 [Brugia malayi]
MKLLVIHDESSKILGHRYLNSQISLYLGLLQLTICIWAMAQHFFSLFRYNQILFCDFINGTEPVLLVGVDIIIFDIGLFHSLWGIDSCVAQHLDGGYGRFMWCVCHILAFAICLPFAFVSRPRPYSLWPLLIQQSAYGVGLLILSLAALPRVLPTFTGDQNSASLLSVSIYATGASLNFFLLYIYWHWYWHVEAMWNSARKLRLNRINSVRKRRTRGTSLECVNVTDDTALQHIQPQNSLFHVQRVTSRKPLTESYQECVAAVMSENLFKTENFVNHDSNEYHGLHSTNKCPKSCDKRNDAHVTDCDDAEELRQAVSHNRTNCYKKLTSQRNPCNHRVRSQVRTSGLQSLYLLSHYTPLMTVPWRPCHPSVQNTKFIRHFNVSQRSSLIG